MPLTIQDIQAAIDDLEKLNKLINVRAQVLQKLGSTFQTKVKLKDGNVKTVTWTADQLTDLNIQEADLKAQIQDAAKALS